MKKRFRPTFLNTQSVLLQALIRGDSYGLDLIERVRELTDGCITLHQGTVYPALRALEKGGLVMSYEKDPLPERGGRPRVYYSLTAAGRRACNEQRLAASKLLGLTAAGDLSLVPA
jgi:PadR family transcriptional regulator PadR